MNVRPGTLAAVVCIVVVGFAIGAWLAIRTLGPAAQSQRVTVASSTVAAQPVQTMAPRPARTAAPTATPTPVSTAASTVAPPASTTRTIPNPAPQGSWQLDEANVQVGTIRWVGSAAVAGDKTIAFTLHKQSVGGRAAVPCEQQTVLHAAFAPNAAPQTVSYQEVNCNGVASSGEVHVTSFSGNGSSFSGSFSQDGVNLGTFTARKL
jgi:cytoskeletal protein RodZ